MRRPAVDEKACERVEAMERAFRRLARLLAASIEAART